MEMSTLLKQVLADPCFSKLGALLEQNHHLTSSQSPSLHNTQELKTFEVNRRTVYTLCSKFCVIATGLQDVVRV